METIPRAAPHYRCGPTHLGFLRSSSSYFHQGMATQIQGAGGGEGGVVETEGGDRAGGGDARHHISADGGTRY
jgi:hypothetical protein